jgi:hypothetical protein
MEILNGLRTDRLVLNNLGVSSNFDYLKIRLPRSPLLLHLEFRLDGSGQS